MNFTAINPATEEKLVTYPGHTPQEVEAKLVQSQKAQAQWKTWSFRERGHVLKRVASILRRQKKKIGTLMTEEMGKPYTQSLAEIEKCVWACEHFAEHAEKYLQPEFVKTEATKSYVSFEPLGVVLGIMPWNYPLWQVFRFAAPTLMAGNGIMLKHASNVPGCALEIQEIFREAGAPKGLFATLLVDSKSALRLIDDPRVAAVSVTGSTSAGKQIASRAGANVKRCVLELGGSDPFIVLSKVSSVQECAENAVQNRIVNGGQSCIAAKRFLVPQKMAREFELEMKKRFAGLVVGDPFDSATQVGPLARGDLRDHLLEQMKRSVRMGAKVVAGGRKWRGKGYFFTPTLLGKIKPTMPVFSEETFGPLAGVMPYDYIRDAISMANATEYGLGASIWGVDAKQAEEYAHLLQSGNVFINTRVASDPRISFGGTKQSGLGKELGELGIKEFVNAKTIWIK